MRVGIRVTCFVCGHMKKPHGRSAPMQMHYCNEDCPGYNTSPLPGCLWPEETEKEFGYYVCSNAVRIDGGQKVEQERSEDE